MKTLRQALTPIALLLVLAGAAEAATLFSASLNNAAGHQYNCRIVNVSGQTRDVKIEIIDTGGGVITGSGTLSLPSGNGTNVNSISPSFAYCKVTVEGGKNSFRGTFTVEEDTGGGDFVTIATTPLQ